MPKQEYSFELSEDSTTYISHLLAKGFKNNDSVSPLNIKIIKVDGARKPFFQLKVEDPFSMSHPTDHPIWEELISRGCKKIMPPETPSVSTLSDCIAVYFTESSNQNE